MNMVDMIGRCVRYENNDYRYENGNLQMSDVWGRVRIMPFRSYFTSPIILDKSTRRKHMSKFPMDKYVTFRCAMNHIGELPEDIIKYLLYLIIGTDKIDLRLKITEIILEYFNIESLNIQFPKEGNLSYGEIHEAMALKMFHISLMAFDKHNYKEQFWGRGVALDFNDDVIQKKISINSEIKCICCTKYSCKLYNDVPICVRCHEYLELSAFKDIVKIYFSNIITIPEQDIWFLNYNRVRTNNNCKEFNKLISKSLADFELI